MQGPTNTYGIETVNCDKNGIEMVGEWVPDKRKNGYYGGPSLKTQESQSLVVNHHVTVRDERDVSTYKYKPNSTDNFPAHLSGEMSKGTVTLSKNQRRKMHRYGKNGYRFNLSK